MLLAAIMAVALVVEVPAVAVAAVEHQAEAASAPDALLIISIASLRRLISVGIAVASASIFYSF